MREMENEVDYEIIDFKGFVKWQMRDDGKYAVDPLFLNMFKIEKNIK